jgi:hypothetical protein
MLMVIDRDLGMTVVVVITLDLAGAILDCQPTDLAIKATGTNVVAKFLVLTLSVVDPAARDELIEELPQG